MSTRISIERGQRVCSDPRGWGFAVALASLLGLGACADDLGTCDPTAARELVYSAQGMAATKGQALLHESCGQAVFCHSASAKGAARYGAPSGMSFDMLPAPTGWPTVIQQRSAIWHAVLSGSMPPGHIGHEKVGNAEWSIDLGMSEDAPRLPHISSEQGKAALRNWLACDAPVVAATRIPSWALRGGDINPDSDAGADASVDWHELYQDIVRPNCASSGCHDASGAGKLSMVDECSAFAQLQLAGSCGKPRLVPGDGASLLVSKLETRKPSCGDPMPPIGPLPQQVVAKIRAWVLAGAPAAACPGAVQP